jgi:hypothetical protein
MGFSDSPVVKTVNGIVVGLMHLPLLGRLVRTQMVVIRYRGRKSGKTFQTPVAYRHKGDRLVIGVAMPDRKAWWRNFLGEGGPITLLDLDGHDRNGHATARRGSDGGVSVSVVLD